MRIILLAFAACLAVGAPALAGCRLGIHDCAVIADEMRAEAIQELRDEWIFRGMPPALRTQYLINRKYDRLGVRMSRYSKAVRNEWARLNGCAYEAGVAAMRNVPYIPSAKCHD
jgi:hypothetical protein